MSETWSSFCSPWPQEEMTSAVCCPFPALPGPQGFTNAEGRRASQGEELALSPCIFPSRAGMAAFSHRGPGCCLALISDPSADTSRTSVLPCSQSGRNAGWMTSRQIPTSRKTGLLSRMQFGEKNTSCKRRAGLQGSVSGESSALCTKSDGFGSPPPCREAAPLVGAAPYTGVGGGQRRVLQQPEVF